MKDIQPDPKRFERKKKSAPCRRRFRRPNDLACTRKEPGPSWVPTGANTVEKDQKGTCRIGRSWWKKTVYALKNMMLMLLPYPVPCSCNSY